MDSLLASLSATRQLLIEALVATVILSLLVTIVVETLKAGMQIGFRRRTFMKWWDRIGSEAKTANNAAGEASSEPTWAQLGMSLPQDPLPTKVTFGDMLGRFGEEALRACALPDVLFMRKIENMGRAILERPSETPDVFLTLTNGAAAAEQKLVIRFDRAIRRSPAISAAAKSDDDVPKISPIILAAQDRTAAAFERNLDDLQLILADEWPLLMYSTSLIAGAGLSFIVAVFVNGLSFTYLVTMIAIGATAGLLSAAARNGVSTLLGARQSS